MDYSRQAPLSTGFPRQEDWSGLPFPSPGDLPDPGIKLSSSVSAGGFFNHWTTREALKGTRDIKSKSAIPGFAGGSVVKDLPARAGDERLIPGLGRSHTMQSSSACAHSYGTCAPEPGNHNGGARMPPTLRPTPHRASAPREKPPQCEGRPRRWTAAPPLHT